MDVIKDLFTSELGVSGIRILLAGLLGAFIGIERESHGQAAGLRTFILIAVGGCLMMMVSLHVAEIYKALGERSSVRVDPGRIASYALAGMGFLGAGAIITGKGSVRGLTTAAGMWLTTGLGLAVGAGYYFPSVFVTFVTIVVLYLLRHTKGFVRRDRYVHLSVRCSSLEDRLLELESTILDAVDVKIQWRRYEVSEEDHTITYSFQLLGKEDQEWHVLVKRLLRFGGVKGVELREGKVT